MGRAVALLTLLAAVVAAVGCGFGAGEEQQGDGAKLRVTRDFGRELLSSASEEQVRQDQTAMRFLRAHNDVETRFGGGFVQTIDGLSGRGSGGSFDWFFYVNGIEADRGAGEYEMSPGDVVQWDYRDWSETMDVRAIVGAFPEPFVHGLEGKRFPVRVECEDSQSGACGRVKDELLEAGVPVTGATLGAPGFQNVIRVVVARWARARQLPSVRVLESGPRESGVFARYAGTDGERLELLDEGGDVVRSATPDSGLVAALRPTDDELVWVVTGGEEAGVDSAAAAFAAAALRDAFAVAVEGDQVLDLPLEEGG